MGSRRAGEKGKGGGRDSVPGGPVTLQPEAVIAPKVNSLTLLDLYLAVLPEYAKQRANIRNTSC